MGKFRWMMFVFGGEVVSLFTKVLYRAFCLPSQTKQNVLCPLVTDLKY